MGISLGANQYGKAENRVVRIYRDTAAPRDSSISTSRPRCAATSPRRTPTATRPTCCPPTPRRTPPSPTPRSTASARRRTTRSRSAGGSSTAAPKADAAQIRVEQYGWDRIPVDGDGHDHAFVRRGDVVRTTVVTVSGRGDGEQVHGGLRLCRTWSLLKSTGLGVQGLPQGRVHDTAGDRRPDHGHLAGRAVALQRHRRRLERDLRQRAGGPARDVRDHLQPGAAGDALPDGPAGARGRARTSPRSSSPRPTSITSSSTSRRSGSRTTARCSSPPTVRTG